MATFLTLRTRKSNLLQRIFLTEDAEIEADELGLEPTACVIGKSMPAERYNKQPASESYVVISQQKDRIAAHYNEGELQRRDAKSLSASPKSRQNVILARSDSPAFQDSEKQSPYSPAEEVTVLHPVLDQVPVLDQATMLDQPSVVIYNFRPQEQGARDSISMTRIASPNRKRDRDEYISDDSSDDPDGSDDADYVGESGEDAHGSSVPSHQLKRARQSALQPKPRPPARPLNASRSTREFTPNWPQIRLPQQACTISKRFLSKVSLRARCFCPGSSIQLPLKTRQSIPALRDQTKLHHIMKTRLAASIPSNPPRKGPALGKRLG